VRKTDEVLRQLHLSGATDALSPRSPLAASPHTGGDASDHRRAPLALAGPSRPPRPTPRSLHGEFVREGNFTVYRLTPPTSPASPEPGAMGDTTSTAADNAEAAREAAARAVAKGAAAREGAKGAAAAEGAGGAAAKAAAARAAATEAAATAGVGGGRRAAALTATCTATVASTAIAPPLVLTGPPLVLAGPPLVWTGPPSVSSSPIVAAWSEAAAD